MWRLELGWGFILCPKLRANFDLRKLFADTFPSLPLSPIQKSRGMTGGCWEQRPPGLFMETGSDFCQEDGDNRVLSVQA